MMVNWNQIKEFNECANSYLSRRGKDINRLSEILVKINRSIKPVIDDFNFHLDLLRLEFISEDKNGNVIKSEKWSPLTGDYTMTRANLKAFIINSDDWEKNEWGKKEFNIFRVKCISPTDIMEHEKSAFEPFIDFIHE